MKTDTLIIGESEAAEYENVLMALNVLSVKAAAGVRHIGKDKINTLFRRSPSRPIHKLSLTPMQTVVWLLSQETIPIPELVDIVCERFPNVKAIDIAWVITDLRREGFLTTELVS